MVRKMNVGTVRLALSASVVFLAAPFARGNVDLTLTPSSPAVPTGGTVRIALTAISDSSPVAISALDAVIVWDHTRLELLGFDITGSPYTWFVTGFLPSADGINNGVGGLPFNDGDAKYSALSVPGAPAVVPPAPGLLVVEFEFRALAATAATSVELAVLVGTSRTAVFANSPPNTNITGDIDFPAVVRIIDCAPGPDADTDGFPDSCDNCPFVFNNDQLDADSDGVGDACDTCPLTPNPDQSEGDTNGNGFVELTDVPIFVDVLLGIDTNPPHVNASDVNCDAAVNALDIQAFLYLLL